MRLHLRERQPVGPGVRLAGAVNAGVLLTHFRWLTIDPPPGGSYQQVLTLEIPLTDPLSALYLWAASVS